MQNETPVLHSEDKKELCSQRSKLVSVLIGRQYQLAQAPRREPDEETVRKLAQIILDFYLDECGPAPPAKK
jgi:hypothetical protein